MEQMAELVREAARRALPPLEGEVRLPGLAAEVAVLRDRWGVPHVSAGSQDDLFFAQGYLVGSERGFQLEAARRLGMGLLADLFGELALPLDRFVRTVGWNRIGRRLAAGWDERSRTMSRAFAAGVRAAAESLPPAPEYAVLGTDPWIPEEDFVPDACASVFLAWTLSRNWDGDLLRAEVAERLGAEAMHVLFPGAEGEPGDARGPSRLELLELAMLPHQAQGSNAWVASGSRTETGRPLLANDPHLAISSPSPWYEIHLRAPGYHATGVALPFSPGVVIGHNERIAWGLTNAEGDVQDLFLERLSEDGREAEHDGGWEPVTVHREEIPVRHRPGPEVLEVRETRNGPLLDSYTVGIAAPTVVEGGIRKSYSLRWAGAEAGVEPSVLYRVNTATDWSSFRDALRGWACPGQNALYADVDGHVGYQCSGLYPVRPAHDGMLPVPGWTSRFGWEGWVPFEDLPGVLDPEDGVLVTANNEMHERSRLIGREFLPPFRARRIAQLLAGAERHSPRSFAAIQRDTVSLSAEGVLPHLLALEPAGERQARALAMLAAWDRDLAAGSAAAALYQVWGVRIAHEVLGPLLGEELFVHAYARRQWANGFLHATLPVMLGEGRWLEGAGPRDEALRRALDAALDELEAALGEDPARWRWGALHRARFAGRLAAVPGLEDVFSAGEVECGGDDQTVCQTLFEPGLPYAVAVLPSWRMILDVGDWDSSLSTLTLGQSGNPASPHQRDMLSLWTEGEHHPMPFSEAAVEAAAVHRLALRPA